MSATIKPRERTAILQSLQAGVVPRIGLRHIQVGRKDEVGAILSDLSRVDQGDAAIRFVVGRFGSGKSFFLNLARVVAIEKRFVVLQADITPDRRLHATGGQARSLYSELMRNLSIRSKPEGGALPNLVQLWISDVDYQARQDGADDTDVARAIHERLKPLQAYVSGYDFASVLGKYLEGFQTGNDELMAAALRWLRGEYATKTEARQDLGVRTIISDPTIYEYLKLLAAFVRMAGYAGLLINLDEMGVLSHRLNNSQARNSNYEMVLRILNDCLQGNASHIGFLFAGTDGFLDDKRRGLHSYEALRSRLAENAFAVDGLKDFASPVIRLPNLTPEDMYVLLHNIRSVHSMGNPSDYIVPDEALVGFMEHCARTLGSEFFLTPRDAVKGFVGLLSVLEQNSNARWQDLLADIQLDKALDPDANYSNDVDEPPAASANSLRHNGDDELASFTL